MHASTLWRIEFGIGRTRFGARPIVKRDSVEQQDKSRTYQSGSLSADASKRDRSDVADLTEALSELAF